MSLNLAAWALVGLLWTVGPAEAAPRATTVLPPAGEPAAPAEVFGGPGLPDVPVLLEGPDLPAGPVLPEGPLLRKTDTALEYLSDFFVFVGREAEPSADRPPRHLLLAFDANRGRDDTSFAAEHFAVLWLEGRGWIELKVTGEMAGAESQLQPVLGAQLPSSARAQVAGNAQRGLVVEVPASRLQLRTDPVRFHTDRRRGADAFATASTGGEVRFEDTTYRGVVHYELCYLAGINPLARTYTDLFGDGFHGVYGLVGDDQPLRLHRSGGRLEPLVGRRSGYGPQPAVVATEASPTVSALPNFSFDTSKKSLAGFFRWPGRYDSAWTWPGAASPSRLRVDLADRETLVNYVFGGVAIAVARGELREGDSRDAVFGFALIVL